MDQELNLRSVISLYYASFEDPRAPSVAPRISPRAPVEHQRLLERKSENPLAFDGIGSGIKGIDLGFLFLSSKKKLTDHLKP